MRYEDVREPVRINTKVSAETNDWLDKKAYEMGLTKSSLVNVAVEQYRRETNAVMAFPELLKHLDDEKSKK